MRCTVWLITLQLITWERLNQWLYHKCDTSCRVLEMLLSSFIWTLFRLSCHHQIVLKQPWGRKGELLVNSPVDQVPQLQREALSSNELVAVTDTSLAWPAVSECVCMCVCWGGEFVFRSTSVGHQPGRWLTPFGPSFLCVCPSEQALFTSLHHYLCRFYLPKSYSLFNPFF